MPRLLILAGFGILFGFFGWGYWLAVMDAPAVSYNTYWGSNTSRRLIVLLASLIAVPFGGWLIKLGLRRQAVASDAASNGVTLWPRKPKGKNGWFLVIDGLGLVIVCGLIIATALAWWNSIPSGARDPGMGPIAVFLGRFVLAFPVGGLLLIGGSGVIYGTIHSMRGLSQVIAKSNSSA